MLQRKIHRMISPKTAPRHRQLPRLILPTDEGQKFMQDVALVLQMPQHPHPRMHALVVPALEVDRVRTKYLQFAAFNFRGQRSNHPPVLELEESPHRSREDHQRHSGMSEDQRLHVPVQLLAISLVIFAVHGEQVCGKAGLEPCRPLKKTRGLTPKTSLFRSRSILPDGSRKP